MGMDVHGLNPKMHKEITDYPTLMMIKSLEKKEEWDKRRDFLKSEDVRNKYWAEDEEYNESNKGIYFRNNCWWWRPLWDFCYNVAPELISSELWGDGHHNSGAGLNTTKTKKKMRNINILLMLRMSRHLLNFALKVEDLRYVR